MFRKLLKLTALCGFTVVFAQSAPAKNIAETPRSVTAIAKTTPNLEVELALKGLKLGDPVFLRIIKSPKPHIGRLHDGVLQIYMQGADGRYKLFKTKDICAASGTLGPKTKTGITSHLKVFTMLARAGLIHGRHIT